MNKLSHSSIQKYLDCPRKYKNHYVERIRPIKTKSALVFGSCLDKGLNALHEGQSLEVAIKLFEGEWNHYLYKDDMVYSKSDLQEELLEYFKFEFPKGSTKSIEEKSWASLFYKGKLMLEACQREVLPLIKSHKAIQKAISFKNDVGDEIHGFLDLIIESHEGKLYLMDNKSSSVTYEADSAKKSQQLVLYYYIEKDFMKIDEVGFFVYNKKINLNKVKTCKVCKTINKSSHKTCNETIYVGTDPINPVVKGSKVTPARCNGEFLITYNPIAEVDIITNVIEESDENRVINDIDKANQGITNQEFEPNFNACQSKYGKCEYWSLCHKNSMDGLEIVKKEEK